jgi:hypothetical protein
LALVWFLQLIECRKSNLQTGTGIWAIDAGYTPCSDTIAELGLSSPGDLYPSAEVLGSDISAIQPHFVPPNVQFEVFDAEAPWDYSSQFDYIHCRYL